MLYIANFTILKTLNRGFNPLSSEGKFCGQLNQSVRCVHSYLMLAILITTSTNNPSRKSGFLESSAKPSLGFQFGSQDMVWLKIQEPLTQGANVLGVKPARTDMMLEKTDYSWCYVSSQGVKNTLKLC